jgi:primase-polymerase (primpol)-like protein
MTCAWCAAPFAGRADARFCSARCRVAANRMALPDQMTSMRRWIRHRAKVPVTVTGGAASSTNAHTWSDFATAQASSVGDGLGFVLAGDGVACIDLDHCIEDGTLSDFAYEVVRACRGTYMEISPSGTGLHIFGLGDLQRGVRSPGFEAYSSGRYMTVTGRRFRRAPLVLHDISHALSLGH